MAVADETLVISSISGKSEESEADDDPQVRQKSVSPEEDPSSNEVKSMDGEPGVRIPGVMTEEGKEEEEEECPFCLFMRSGPCGQVFRNWEKCVEEADKGGQDMVTKCWPATEVLRKCMEANTDYYGLVMAAEKAMEEERTAREKDSSTDVEDIASEVSPAKGAHEIK